MNSLLIKKYFVRLLFAIINISCLRASKHGILTLLFAGDINFSNPVRRDVESKLYAYNDTFLNVASYIREADVALGNLESPFVPEEALPDENDHGGKLIFLKADKQSASALRFAGFDVMTLANNHLVDFGEIPVNYTIEALGQFGIKSIGVTFGRYDSMQVPLVIERKGIRMGFLGYCLTMGNLRRTCKGYRELYKAGPAIYQKDIAAKDIENLKKLNVDIIAVFMHWGDEYRFEPNVLQKSTAEHLRSLGVHVIIGCHPHVEEPHWYQGNSVIAYSLGNLLFFHSLTPDKSHLPGFASLHKREEKHRPVVKRVNPTTLGRLFRVQISRRGVIKAQYLPYNINRNQTNHCLQPTPLNNTGWIDVCGSQDKACLRD